MTHLKRFKNIFVALQFSKSNDNLNEANFMFDWQLSTDVTCGNYHTTQDYFLSDATSQVSVKESY